MKYCLDVELSSLTLFLAKQLLVKYSFAVQYTFVKLSREDVQINEKTSSLYGIL